MVKWSFNLIFFFILIFLICLVFLFAGILGEFCICTKEWCLFMVLLYYAHYLN